MVGITKRNGNRKLTIGVSTMPYRKNLCLVVEEGNALTKYATFNNEKAAAQTALMICCIVLNKQHNFGKDRLKALADEVNANIKEFYADPEAGCYNIKRAMEQIGFDDNIADIMDTLAVHDDLKAKLSRIKK